MVQRFFETLGAHRKEGIKIYLSPLIVEMIAREHQKDLLEEATRIHAARSVRAGKPDTMRRLCVRLGDLLIRIGQRLKNLQSPRVHANTGTYHG